MEKNYELEPYVSPEQNRLFTTLCELSSKQKDELDARRKKALTKLLHESIAKSSVQKELRDYFSFRMDRSTYDKISEIAKKLYEDDHFVYNDTPLILNNLDPFFESITIEDIVLAYHNYRLSKDDVSLSQFVKLLGLYVEYAFETDESKVKFSVSDDEVLTQENALSLMSEIVTFVDDYLQNVYDKRDQFSKMYKLEKENRITLSERIEEEADQSFEKKTPLDICISRLIHFLSKYENLNGFDEFLLESLLEKMFKNCGITSNMENREPNSVQWPTLANLLALSESEFHKEKSAIYIENSYKHIIGALTCIRRDGMETVFNKKAIITEDDLQEAEDHRTRVNTKATFENIQRRIRVLFIINIAIEKIPGVSFDKDKMKRRRKMCRQLCDIFTDDDAYESINDEDEINQEKILEKESESSDLRADVFESFIMTYGSSSIETLMEERQKLLDRARLIAPEDVKFLEESSSRILDLLMKKADDGSVTTYVDKIRRTLIYKNHIELPETVVTALATAELLYEKYANDKYAGQGFDYSSISALYYQAFENAYNLMIWGKYASYLNALQVDDRDYPSVLAEQYHKTAFKCSDPGYGYLPPMKEDWRHYSYYNGKLKKTFVKTTCMYSSFACFIGDKDNYREFLLPGFYKWLATEVGFSDYQNMTTDSQFMNLLNAFRKTISTAVDNRNNASHGGNKILLAQCKIDKATVLANLQQSRSTNLGLIQQLIDILGYASSADKT